MDIGSSFPATFTKLQLTQTQKITQPYFSCLSSFILLLPFSFPVSFPSELDILYVSIFTFFFLNFIFHFTLFPSVCVFFFASLLHSSLVFFSSSCFILPLYLNPGINKLFMKGCNIWCVLNVLEDSDNLFNEWRHNNSQMMIPVRKLVSLICCKFYALI